MIKRAFIGILGIGFLLIALGLFMFASYCQQRVDQYKEILSHRGYKIGITYDVMVEFIEKSKTAIPTFATTGTIFLLIGSVCLLTSMKLLGLILILVILPSTLV